MVQSKREEIRRKVHQPCTILRCDMVVVGPTVAKAFYLLTPGTLADGLLDSRRKTKVVAIMKLISDLRDDRRPEKICSTFLA